MTGKYSLLQHENVFLVSHLPASNNKTNYQEYFISADIKANEQYHALIMLVFK